MTRDEICKLLTDAGHSPAKALEIAIDYERGNDYATKWVAELKATKPSVRVCRP